MEILLRLPYPCIYIDFGEFAVNEFKGVFVCFEQDMTPERFGQLELRLCFVISPTERTLDLSLHLGAGKTISDGIEDAAELSRDNMIKLGVDTTLLKDIIDENVSDQKELFSKVIQLILYICAENADINENEKQKEITRKPSSHNKVKDAFREIRKWDVGVKISKAIKHHNQTNRNDNEESSDSTHSTTFSSNGSTKRPHVRRGHWHHYWVGSDKKNNRKLILKWTAPMFIGNADDTITTINEL